MSDKGERTPQDHPLTGQASIELRGGQAELGELSVITDSESRGLQTFSVEQTKLEQKAKADSHRRDLAKTKQDYELAEKTNDNNLRRWCFGGIVSVILLVLVISTILAFIGPAENRANWMAIVTTILGGLVGAIAGYFAGKSGT